MQSCEPVDGRAGSRFASTTAAAAAIRPSLCSWARSTRRARSTRGGGHDDPRVARLGSPRAGGGRVQVTNYTTSGLLCPKYNGSSLISTGVSLLIGIPFNGLFFGEIAARYFAHVMNRAEREAEEESAAGEAAALSGGGDGYGATAGEGGGAADGEADVPQRHKAITDDPYVDFLHQELVRSGLVARSHLEWLQSMYELQQTTGDTSTPEAQGGE